MPPKPSRTKSPLEKLVKLLEESKDGDTLRLAARKICDIARQHPRQLPAVFRQILHALFNQTSKARISAGEALGLIAAAIPHHAPEDLAAALHITGDACKALQPDNRLSSLDRFRLDHVREKGRALLVATVSKNALDLLSPKNRTIAISRDLGLAEPPALPGNVPHNCTLPALASPFTSARECEKADDQVRRKRDRHEAEPGSESHVAGSETPGAEAISQTGRDSDDAEDDRIAAGGWPFELIADTLLAALLDTDWRVRHGAAVGLREILKDHARCAAVMAPVCGRLSGWRASGARGPLKLAEFGAGEVREAFAQRQEWLDRAIGLLVSLIVLDDVADYGADQIMAPVRETAAQALALASTALTLNMRLQLLNTLVSLQTSDAWKVHYGAMLGIKYMLATSADDAAALLPVAMPALMAALRDGEDDVQVVAAQVCVPSVGATASLDPSAVATLAEVLWNMLPDLSDISGATSSVLQLLGALYSRDETATEADAQARLLLLWPFFHHTSSEVQVEACCCCRVLCKIIFQAEIATPTDPLLAQTARQVLHLSYQKLLTTKHPRVADGAADLAIFIVERCPVSMLGAALDAQLIHTLSGLPCMPLGEPLPRECLFMSESSAHSPRFRTEVIGGGEDDACVAGRKIRCAKILARALELCAAHPEQPTCHLAATNMQNMMGTFLQHPSVTAQMFAALVYLFWLLRCRGPAQSVPAAVHEQLFAALSNAPLVHMQELSTLHSQVIANLASLLNALSEAQTPAQLPLGFSLDSVDASYATTILAAVAPAVPDDDSHHVAAAHAAATAAVERLIEEAGVLRSVLCAMVAAACAAWRGLPERVTSLVQPLMGGLRRIADSQLHAEVLAPAIAELMLACAHRTPSPNDKILHHLNTLAFGTRSDVAAESTPSVASGEQYAANGAVSVLKMLALRAADSLDTRLPQLWDLIISPPVAYAAATGTPSHVQRTAMLRAASLLRCIAADLHPNLHERLKPLLPTLIACMQRAADDDEETALVATALAALSAAQPDVHLEFLASTASAYMEASEPPPFRVAAVSLLNALLDTSTAVTNALLPYLLLLATPALACMTDPVPRVRVPAAQAFGRIVALLPLAPLDALPATPTLSTKLRAKREADAKFLQQLMSARIEPYVPPVMPKGVELRHYQRDGISWLAFLRRFGLHGILADDMGLGKTIQSLTIVAAAMHDGRSTAPSLIVCPASLVGHWEAEARQYFGHYGMRPVAVQGSAVQRAALQEQVAAEGEPGRVLVVTSYDVVRNSMAWLSQTTFEYFILDEGHIIRNPKAKVSRACKQIAARHRLILSGTPIQNSARELWALFDFLMPGLLGTETAFQRRFKATAAPSVGVSRQAAAKDQEALMLALNELHQQVLPFILRRSKDQVLQDLPPKLMQDIMCDLSPLQRTLYDGVMAAQVAGGKNAAQTASFELLIYLRKLCSHPCLAISWDFAEHVAAAQTAMPECSGTIELKQALPCLAQSPKLQALQQLLTNCGIIKGEPTDGDALVGAAADAESGHRVLVFAQLRTMLDLVESTVLGPAGLPFVRLDGGVKPKDRQEVVQRFNGDPTIPVMLLTTAVGSLGLNLTSADTVVFLEHDWNPMKDMQAMDRAHRLGQKRIVSVYRLLMRGTLEERIMSLQHFKKEVASSVVNAENIALESMETEGLLDVMGASASAGQGGLPLVQQPAQQHEAPDGSEQYDDSSMAAFLKRYQSSVFTEPS